MANKSIIIQDSKTIDGAVATGCLFAFVSAPFVGCTAGIACAIKVGFWTALLVIPLAAILGAMGGFTLGALLGFYTSREGW